MAREFLLMIYCGSLGIFEAISFSLMSQIIYLVLLVRTSPMGRPSPWLCDVLQWYILCYDVVMGPRENWTPKVTPLMYYHVISYVMMYFDLDKVSLGKKCAPLDLVKLIHVLIRVKVISTVDDILISTVGWKSKLGFVSLKSYIKEKPHSLYPIEKFGTIGSWRIIQKKLWDLLSYVDNWRMFFVIDWCYLLPALEIIGESVAYLLGFILRAW